MALTFNIRSLISRIILADLRPNVRFYADTADKATDEEEKTIDPAKDRTKIIPVETSMKYLQSKAYQQTYGENSVWVLYRRNHKGGFAPRKTRKSCVRNGVISTGNPCPICRDEYLVLDHRNTKLLEQFISQYTGQIQFKDEPIISSSSRDIHPPYHTQVIYGMILDPFKTGLCQKKHKELLVAIERAWDQGLLTYDVPFREYDYSLYNKSV